MEIFIITIKGKYQILAMYSKLQHEQSMNYWQKPIKILTAANALYARSYQNTLIAKTSIRPLVMLSINCVISSSSCSEYVSNTRLAITLPYKTTGSVWSDCCKQNGTYQP